MLTRENDQNKRLVQALDHAKTLEWKNACKPVCACCGKRIERAVRDHNHVTLTWRGEVCHSCNTLIGYAEWAFQNPDKFDMIMRYLKKHDPMHEML